MHDFLMALMGGAMIGLAAVLLMATNGSIMGISGIASRLMPPLSTDWQWRLVFLGGVLAAPLIMTLITGERPAVEITSNVVLLIIGGLLVGFGTVLGNGCTSGHGVCGLSRLSTRSIIATGVFMFFAFVTVFISRHILGA
ncbi:YeeE/YedE thiosulfate transporter family protein [Granulosicoccus sp.]|nr:YeeE/YedE thiosulfate transporter family protein [Granulosicoccus sp.]MDB4224674.1 YeeE/YedE thiosulfate transporter family protein [Granulosicoccus sp.]